MEFNFEEKQTDNSSQHPSTPSWLIARKYAHSHGNSSIPIPSAQRHTYAQALTTDTGRDKADSISIQVRQRRRSSTPPSLPSKSHSMSLPLPFPLPASSSSPSTTEAIRGLSDEEVPRRPGALLCLKFIKGMQHSTQDCPFDHPLLPAGELSYLKRVCSFFPTGECKRRLGHKQKSLATKDEEVCKFVHQYIYWDDVSALLIKSPVKIAAITDDMRIVANQMKMKAEVQAVTRRQRKANTTGNAKETPDAWQEEQLRKAHEVQLHMINAERQAAEKDREKNRGIAASTATVATMKEDADGSDVDTELTEHADSTVFHPLLDDHVSSSSSSPSTPCVSIASTSRSSTISPVNLPSISVSSSGHSPSTSSTPSRFSQSIDFDSSASFSSLSASSSMFNFPVTAAAVTTPKPTTSATVTTTGVKGKDDLYSSNMSPTEDSTLDMWSHLEAPFNARGSSDCSDLVPNCTLETGNPAGNGIGIAGYHISCNLSALPSGRLSPGVLWRQLSNEDKQQLIHQQQKEQQIQQPLQELVVPMAMKRPKTPILIPTHIPAIPPQKMNGTAPTVATNAVAPSQQVSGASFSAFPDPFRPLVGDLHHSLKALIYSFHPPHPDDFFDRLDSWLSRNHVSAAHPILKAIFMKKLPQQEAFVKDVLQFVKKVEENRLNKQFHTATAYAPMASKAAPLSTYSGNLPNIHQSLPVVSIHSHNLINSHSTPTLPLMIPVKLPAKAALSHPLVYLPAPLLLANSNSAPVLNAYAQALPSAMMPSPALFTPAASIGSPQTVQHHHHYHHQRRKMITRPSSVPYAGNF